MQVTIHDLVIDVSEPVRRVDIVRSEREQVSVQESEIQMSIKQEAQTLMKAYFASNAASDKTITAQQLTDAISDVTEHDYSAKTVRARLRVKFTRQSEFKNATWRITLTTASESLAFYMRQQERKAS